MFVGEVFLRTFNPEIQPSVSSILDIAVLHNTLHFAQSEAPFSKNIYVYIYIYIYIIVIVLCSCKMVCDLVIQYCCTNEEYVHYFPLYQVSLSVYMYTVISNVTTMDFLS